MLTPTTRNNVNPGRVPAAGRATAVALALATAVGVAMPAAAQERWGVSEGGAGPGSLVAQVGAGESIFAVVCRQEGMHPVIAVGRELLSGNEAPERIMLRVDSGRTYALADLQANQQLYFTMVARDAPFFDDLAQGLRLFVSTPGTSDAARLALRGSARALAPVLERCDGSAPPPAVAPPPPPDEPLEPGVTILRTPGFRAEVMPGWCGGSASGRLIATQDIADQPQAIDQLLGALAATLAQVCPEAERVVVSVHAANGAHVGDLRLEDGALWRATADAARKVAAAPADDADAATETGDTPDGSDAPLPADDATTSGDAPAAGTTPGGDTTADEQPAPPEDDPAATPTDAPAASEEPTQPETGG